MVWVSQIFGFKRLGNFFKKQIWILYAYNNYKQSGKKKRCKQPITRIGCLRFIDSNNQFIGSNNQFIGSNN